jgi:hypothetical protein
MKVLATAVVLLSFTGCAHWLGPAHGFFYATGSAPTNDSCLLSVVSVSSSDAPKEWAVSGNFRQNIPISPSRKGHHIVLRCGDVIVAERTFKYGRDVGIGRELAVNGSTP